MRGSDERSGALFSYVDLEAGVPVGHPLRTIRVIVDEALASLSPSFHDLYARVGRPSIPPEQLLRALLLQAFYSIRSERQLMERLDFDLLFRWFVGLGIEDAVWNHSTFSKNRDRLLAGDIAAEFLARVLDQPQVRRLLSSEHFSVDGSLVEAWASMKSFRPKDEPGEPPPGGDRNRSRDFHGERRANDSPSRSAPTPRRRWEPAKRPPIPTPGCTAKARRSGATSVVAPGSQPRARRRSSASSGTC
jgi:transposase